MALLLVGVAAAALIFGREAPETYDDGIMMQVTRSLTHGSVVVSHDPLGLNTPYSSYGIGLSLLMLPLYAFGSALGQDPVSMAMNINPILFAATGAFVLLICRALAASLGQALLTAILVSFGTALFPYVSTGFSETGVALSIAAGMYAVELLRLGRQSAAILAGGAAGLALLMRTDSLLLVVPFLAVAAHLSWPGVRTARLFAFGFAPELVVFLGYNWARFGSLWSLGYQRQTFNHPWLVGIWGQLASPGRGLLLYVPLSAVAIWGFRWAWKTSPVLTGLAAAFLLSRLVFFAGWWGWHGGTAWGPRFLVPAMPAFAVGLVEVVRRFASLSWILKVAIGVLAAVSIGVQFVGVANRYEMNDLAHAMYWVGPRNAIADDVASERTIDRLIFDWRYFPITDELAKLRSGQAITSKYLTSVSPHPEVAIRLFGISIAALFGALIAALLAGRSSRSSQNIRRARAPESANNAPEDQAGLEST